MHEFVTIRKGDDHESDTKILKKRDDIGSTLLQWSIKKGYLNPLILLK